MLSESRKSRIVMVSGVVLRLKLKLDRFKIDLAFRNSRQKTNNYHLLLRKKRFTENFSNEIEA